MEARVKNVIINVDAQTTEEDEAFITQQANVIVGYLLSDTALKRIAHLMFAETGIMLAKIALIRDLKDREEKKDGTV